MPLLSLTNAPVAPEARVMFRYSDNFSITSDATTPKFAGSEHSYRLNSLYDPDFTSTGHQPYMYDQFMAFYGRYRVDKVDVEIDVVANPNTTQMVHAIVQGPSGGLNISGSSLSALLENTRVKSAYALATAVVPSKMRFSVDIPTYLGIGKAAYEADLSLYSAVAGANPSRVCFMNIATTALAGTSQTIQCNITMIYHAKLWDPVTFGQS